MTSELSVQDASHFAREALSLFKSLEGRLFPTAEGSHSDYVWLSSSRTVGNSLSSHGVVGSKFGILSLLKSICKSEVMERVISGISVNMIYFTGWPLSGHVENSEAVDVNLAAKESEPEIFTMSNHIPDQFPGPFVDGPRTYNSNFTGVRGVGDILLHYFKIPFRVFGLSHGSSTSVVGAYSLQVVQ